MLRNLNELFPKVGRNYRYNPETLEISVFKPSGLLKLKKTARDRYVVRTVASQRYHISEQQMRKALDAFNQEN